MYFINNSYYCTLGDPGFPIGGHGPHGGGGAWTPEAAML